MVFNLWPDAERSIISGSPVFPAQVSTVENGDSERRMPPRGHPIYDKWSMTRGDKYIFLHGNISSARAGSDPATSKIESEADRNMKRRGLNTTQFTSYKYKEGPQSATDGTLTGRDMRSNVVWDLNLNFGIFSSAASSRPDRFQNISVWSRFKIRPGIKFKLMYEIFQRKRTTLNA